MSNESYLLANQPSELERLQLADGTGGRALDVGCGAMGWLRILSEWVGPSVCRFNSVSRSNRGCSKW
jgi:hypothetical protein